MAVIGWLVFAATRSPGFVGLAFTLRLAPLVLAGVPIGALSDRVGRVRLLQGSNLVAAATSFGIVGLAISGPPSIAVLLAASAALGFADSGRMVCGNNLVFELAGELEPTRAIALSNFVAGIGQVVGGALSGVALSVAGPAPAAAIIGGGYLASALLLVGVRDPSGGRSVATAPFAAAVRDGLAILRRVPTVGMLIAVALVVEMFAFSCVALDPVFAGQLFLVGPIGLGLIVSTRACGRLTGSGALALIRPRQSVGRALAIAVLGFGVALAVYALAPNLVVALPVVFVVGIASAVLDVLVLTAVQAGVEAPSRGRAAGLWVLMIGLQPVGVLEVGLVAQLEGARFAQELNGAIVAVFGVLLLGTGFGRRIRAMGTVSPPVV